MIFNFFAVVASTEAKLCSKLSASKTTQPVSSHLCLCVTPPLSRHARAPAAPSAAPLLHRCCTAAVRRLQRQQTEGRGMVQQLSRSRRKKPWFGFRPLQANGQSCSFPIPFRIITACSKPQPQPYMHAPALTRFRLAESFLRRLHRRCRSPAHHL